MRERKGGFRERRGRVRGKGKGGREARRVWVSE